MDCLGVGIGFLGEGISKVMDYPCIRQPKRKLPENGSLHFIFFVKKGGLGKGLGLLIEAFDQKPAFV